jgi:fibronectin type 3 domain-containing protein
VYRSKYDVNTGKWTSYKWIKTVDAKELSYVDKKATSGEKYKYKVKAFGINSKGTTKATSEIVYLASTKTTIKNTETGIKVSWTKVQGAEKYRVYRSEYNASTGKWSSFETLKTVSSKTLSYTDKTVKEGGSYKYRVRAIKGKTFSSYKTTEKIECTK